MALFSEHPKRLYPNRVAGDLIALINAAGLSLHADFFEQDLIYDGETILASERVQGQPVALLNVVRWEEADEAYGNDVVQDVVTVRVRVCNQNTREMEVQQQECIVLAQQVRAVLRASFVGQGVVRCGPVEEELNEPMLSVYSFDTTTVVVHDTSEDLPQP